MCETMPRGVREVIPGTEELVFRQPYVAGTVVSTCAREGRGRARASYSHPRDNKRISIDECPMMLLPRAQVRHNFNAYTLRRRFTTVADNGFQDLQLSTISVSDWVDAGGRPTHKSALRTPGSRRKSEADSGFGSLKRCVTFEDLSESSLNRSPDELSSSSGGDNKPGNRDDDDGESVLSAASYEDRRTYDLPEHLDSFGDNDKVCVAPNKKKKREQEPPPHPEDKHHPGDCNSCPQCQKDDARMRKYFGGVDYFLDWIISKWSKRKELQILTKSNFVVRGIKPHFCNFIQGVQLHERDINSRPRSRQDGGADDDHNDGYDHGTVVSTDGISLGQWRHRTSGSGTEGRPGSPSSVGDRLDDDVSSKLNTDAWPRSLYGAKINTDSDGDNKDRLKVNKENELRPYIQIPSPEPPMELKPAWKDTGKKSSKASTGKKGGKAGKASTGGAGGAGGEGNGGDGGKKRSCIKKKDKKKMDRHREGTMDSEPQVEHVTTIMEEKKTPEPEKTDSDSPQADSKIPDLPSSNKQDKLREQRADRARRQLIEAEFLRSDLNELLMQEMRDHRKDFDFDADSMSDDALSKTSDSVSDLSDMDLLQDSYDSNRVRMSSWLTGRLALSQQSSRFTLPMDMKVLEKMTPQDYLRTYCVVSSRRHILYQKIHSKNRDKTGVIPFKDIEKALKDVLVNTISKEEVAEVCQLLEIDEETHIDYQLFCGVAAFAERILYPKFVTEDTAELPEFQREKIECADFCALEWKFHGVNVNPPVKKMLKSLG